MSTINAITSLGAPSDPAKAAATAKPPVAPPVRDQDSVTISAAARAAQGGGDKDHDGDAQ